MPGIHIRKQPLVCGSLGKEGVVLADEFAEGGVGLVFFTEDGVGQGPVHGEVGVVPGNGGLHNAGLVVVGHVVQVVHIARAQG